MNTKEIARSLFDGITMGEYDVEGVERFIENIVLHARMLPRDWRAVPIEIDSNQAFNAAFSLCAQFGQEFTKGNELFAKAVYREFVRHAPPLPPVSGPIHSISSTLTVPKAVMGALDRMITPLHASVLSGATAQKDAHDMRVIRDFIVQFGGDLTLTAATLENSLIDSKAATYKLRVRAERKQLVERLGGLERFIDAGHDVKTTLAMLAALKKQASIMRLYIGVLDERIALFEETAPEGGEINQ